MGAAIFLILFVLGFILSTAGGIIGLVEAFRVNTVWGLLYLFVPFAALVFFIKFWNRKWTRNGFLLSLAGLASSLIALPFLGGFISQRMANLGGELENIQIEPVPSGEEPAAEEPPAAEFAEPIVPAAPQLSAIARAELIQSTDPNERLQQINSSRPDPFATVPIPPKPQVAPPPPAPGGGGGTGGGGTVTAGGTAGGGATATAPTPTAPGGGGTAGQPGGGATGPGGPGSIGLPPIGALPSLPQPTLAEGVLVSGVVKIGNENFAIVQAPTDSTSQYVKAGQRLANGQVLVKRIEVRGSDPVVVLEQNGIEVSRPVTGGAVEEAAAPPEAAEQAQGAVPPLPPVPSI